MPLDNASAIPRNANRLASQPVDLALLPQRQLHRPHEFRGTQIPAVSPKGLLVHAEANHRQPALLRRMDIGHRGPSCISQPPQWFREVANGLSFGPPHASIPLSKTRHLSLYSSRALGSTNKPMNEDDVLARWQMFGSHAGSPCMWHHQRPCRTLRGVQTQNF